MHAHMQEVHFLLTSGWVVGWSADDERIYKAVEGSMEEEEDYLVIEIPPAAAAILRFFNCKKRCRAI